MTKFTEEQLVEVLQAPYRDRWLIIRTARPQSVAEHMWRSWLIAMHMYDTIFEQPHNSDERQSLSEHMLLHDVTEVLTGDIPSTIKRLMDELAPGMWPKVDEALFNRLGVSEARNRQRMAHTLIGSIAKIADLTEATIFLEEWGGAQCRSIIQELCGKIDAEIESAKSAHKLVPLSDWVKIHQIARNLRDFMARHP